MCPLRCGLVASITALCGLTVVSGILSPRNVRLTSYNLDLVLKWDPPGNVTVEVLYTTGFRRFPDNAQLTPACVNTSALHCDLTDPNLGLKIMEFGEYSAAVRALTRNQTSEWVHSEKLSMDRDTVIGPPAVSLVSSGAALEVSISDPEFRLSTVANVFGPPKYHISYWPQGHKHMATSVLVQQNRAVLSDLQPWTEYCVQVHVQVATKWNVNPPKPSEPVCESTTYEESAPWLAAVMTFIAVALAVALVVTAVHYRKRIVHYLCPKDTLPEYLNRSSHSPLSLAPQEEGFHPVSLIPNNCAEKELSLEDECHHCIQTHTSTEQT